MDFEYVLEESDAGGGGNGRCGHNNFRHYVMIIVYNDIMKMNDDVMGRDLISSGSSSSSRRERARASR